MKLHLGCGSCYLTGYINVDAAPDYMAFHAPKDVLKANSTTFENYYKHEFGKGTGITIADVMADIKALPFAENEAEQAIMLHVLEHFPKYELDCVLQEIRRVLKPSGEFIVGVPDLLGNAKLVCDAKTVDEEEWAVRLIDGTQKNKWFHHYCSFTHRTLLDLLSKNGFGDFRDLPNINFYPALHISARKV